MALAALAVEFIFGHWNYTTVLNIFFLMLAAALVLQRYGSGTTMLFPVFHPGALFGFGDGHAAMADG
jgi:hypothetical protein